MAKDGDMAIVGGGLNGQTCALALAAAGFHVHLIDRVGSAEVLKPGFDGRVTSIAWGSALALDGLGVWDRIVEHAQPILDIRVTDRDSRMFLHFDHRETGDHPMGWIVENRHVRCALDEGVGHSGRIVRIDSEVTRHQQDEGSIDLHLSDGRIINTSLVIACDGVDSAMRKQAEIGAWRHVYNQTAIVCSVRHERPHRGVAHERFLASGPFAILPLPGHISSIVWTERDVIAERILQLERDELAVELQRRFGGFLGGLSMTGPVWRYPLRAVMAHEMFTGRLVLAGDAAHAIHPVAGQGFNLGIRDCITLAEVLGDGRKIGLDPGDRTLLDDWARKRRVDVQSLFAVTHGLNRLFSNRDPALAILRRTGLELVNRTPPLKRFFMRDAMGMTGSLPRLVRNSLLLGKQPDGLSARQIPGQGVKDCQSGYQKDQNDGHTDTLTARDRGDNADEQRSGKTGDLA